VSQAGFEVRFEVFNASTNAQIGSTIVVGDDTSGAMFGTPGGDSDTSAGHIGYSSNALNVTGLKLSNLTATSNAPSPAAALLSGMTASLRNESATDYRVRITLSDDQFNTPGAVGDVVSFYSMITSATAGGTGASGTYVTKVFEPNESSDSDGAAVTNALSIPLTPGSPTTSDSVYFTRSTSTYTLQAVYDVTLNAGGGEVNFSTTSVLAAPAPPGLAMMIGALPFAGLLRLRRRPAKVEAATAA